MRPPSQRTTLPFLMSLDFHGASEYLEEFAAQIDSPALIKITIWLFNQIFFDIPQFRHFISHLDARGFPTMSVEHSAESVSVSLIRRGESTPNTICVLGTSCRRLDWQLSFVTQILTELSPFLSSVHLLELLTPSESGFPTGGRRRGLGSVTKVFSTIYSCQGASCLADETCTRYRAGSGHGLGGHGRRSLIRTVIAALDWISQIFIRSESR
jgi:hypothetical protein